MDRGSLSDPGCLLQRIDLSAEGADPVLLQNVDGFLGLVHSQDDDGQAAFPQSRFAGRIDNGW